MREQLPYGNSTGARVLLVGILVASLAPLAAAVIGDLEFGLAGCSLSAYQRVPYLLAAGLVGIAILAPPSNVRLRLILVLCALFFAGSLSIAVLREGVEEGWWAGPDETLFSPGPACLRTVLSLGLVRSTCDPLAIPIGTVSLTMLNFTYAGVLALICIVAAVISDDGSGVLRSRGDKR